MEKKTVQPFMSDRHTAQIADSNWLAVLFDENKVFKFLRIGGLGIGQHLILKRFAIESPDGFESVLFADAIRNIGDRHDVCH